MKEQDKQEIEPKLWNMKLMTHNFNKFVLITLEGSPSPSQNINYFEEQLKY